MDNRVAVVRTLTGYALAAVAVALPWPLLLVLAWDEWGASSVGPVAAARMAPYVLLSWAVGTLGDRVRRDLLLLATLVLRLALLTGTALAIAGDHLLVAVLLAAGAVACGTPAYPTVAAALPELAGDDRARATDALVTIEVAAWVVGPAAGGLLLVPAARPGVPVLAVALLLVALLLAVGVRLPSAAQERRSSATVRGMLRSVAGDRTVLGALGVAGLVNVVNSATAVALLPLTRGVWGHDEAAFGVATAWLGFGALGAPLLWWVRGPAERRRTWGLAVLGLATVWVGVAPVPLLALPVLALAGAVSVVVESSVTQTLQVSVADGHRAGALGLGDSVMVLGALVGALVAPVLAAAGGARAAFVVCALACLGAAATSRWRSRGRRPWGGVELGPADPDQARSVADHWSSDVVGRHDMSRYGAGRTAPTACGPWSSSGDARP